MQNKHEIDEEGARKGFEVVQPLLEDVKRRSVSTNMAKAVRFAASVGRKVQQPDMHARFARLHADEFDMKNVELLEKAALATWYATMRHSVAQVGADHAQVPRELVDAATEVKERMFRVVEYHLDSNKKVAAELADIRQGSGYEDLMEDLLRLAELYRTHNAVLSRDQTHYRAGDRKEAGRLAHEIHAILGDGNDNNAEYWADQVARAWSFLVAVYEEVSVTGRWLYRREGGDELFPSLYSVGRSARRRRSDGTDEPGAPDTPDEAPADEPTPAAG